MLASEPNTSTIKMNDYISFYVFARGRWTGYFCLALKYSSSPEEYLKLQENKRALIEILCLLARIYSAQEEKTLCTFLKKRSLLRRKLADPNSS